MKKTLITLLILTVISAVNLYAQTSEDIYIIGTSVDDPIKYVTGLNRNTLSIDPGDRNPTIVFSIRPEGWDYYLDFFHLDYLKAPNDIVDVPLTRLSEFRVIDVDDFLATHTKREALKWFQTAFDQTSYENEGKKRIWIIDRNDFYKSSSSLASADRMKLIPVIIYPESLPEERIVD